MEDNNKSLRIKVVKLTEKATKDALLLTLAVDIHTPVNRVFNTMDGYVILCDKKQADHIISEKGEEKLLKQGFKLKLSPEITAKKTLLVRKIDPDIGAKSKEDLKEEIEKTNKVKITDIIKIPDRNNFFKIIFHNIETADRILKKGFTMFHMSVAEHQLEKEIFYSIRTCFNCYELNTHTTNKCPNPKMKMCSTCAKEGHIYTECKEEQKTCLNCGGDHHALALACPKKKEIIQKLRLENRNQINEATGLAVRQW